MTTTITPTDVTAPAESSATREKAVVVGKSVGRYVIAYAAALVIFGAIVMMKFGPTRPLKYVLPSGIWNCARCSMVFPPGSASSLRVAGSVGVT